MALSRRKQFEKFMDALERTTTKLVEPDGLVDFDDDDPIARRKAAVRFVVAVSAACAVVGALSGGLSFGAKAAVFFFALPVCLLFVPEIYPSISMEDMAKPLPWYVVSVPMGLVLSCLVTATLKASATGAMWAVDANTVALLGQCIAREMAKRSGYWASSSEIVLATVMVCSRCCLYLHVFHILGGDGSWFSSP